MEQTASTKWKTCICEHLLKKQKQKQKQKTLLVINKATLQFSPIEMIYHEKGQGSVVWVEGGKELFHNIFPSQSMLVG